MGYKKRAYTVLIACFIAVLLLPAFGILYEKENTALIARMENRTINPKPHSVFATKDFFNEFQNWFEDRLLERNNLIQLWANLNGKLFHVLISTEVCMGKDGYLYSPFFLIDEMADREQKLEQLSCMQKICDNYKTRFVFNMVPHAEWMLGEQLLERHRPADIKKLEKELERDLQKRGIDYCIFGQKMLLQPLYERKNMYYKDDLHWNSKGAFFGAKELLRHLKLNKIIDSENIYEIEVKVKAGFYTYKIGWEPLEYISKMPWSNDFVKNFYIETHIGDRIIQGEIENGDQKGEVIIINRKASNNVTVLLIGDSFFGALKKYLMQDIGTIVFSHNMDVLKPKTNIDLERMIQLYKPEIVVFEKTGLGFYRDSYQSIFSRWKL